MRIYEAQADVRPKTVKELDVDDQPREKAEKYGCGSLSTADLWALILRTGLPGKPITELCRDLMRENDGRLHNLERRDRREILQIKGIGKTKAIQIEAVLEIVRRYCNEELSERPVISCANDIDRLMRHRIANLGHEEIWVVLLNRKNAAGEDKLYFVCRTYQRFTKAGVCTSHTIKEETVTQAVVEKVQEVCGTCLQANRLLPQAQRAVAKAIAEADNEKESSALKAKLDGLSAHLDKIYMDKLSGVLDETDFQRIYAKVKADRAVLEQRLRRLTRPILSPEEQSVLAKKLTEQFLETARTNRELLVSLIERIELTADKKIIIKFRFRQLEANF